LSQYLTTKEVAALIRSTERKVYDLVARNQIPFHKNTGKLLFPREEIKHWLEAGKKPMTPPPTLAGSHDPCLEEVMRLSEIQIATLWNGSSKGLDLIEQGQAAISALHIYDTSEDAWNIPAIRQRFANANVVLIEWAKRQRGIMIAPHLKDQITCFTDIIGKRISVRQKGSGSQILFDHLLSQHGIKTDKEIFTAEKHTELEAALSLIDGTADVAFGLQYLASKYQLGFLPLIDERVDLLVSRQFYFEDPFQQFLTFCQDSNFTNITSAYSGYDFSNFGKIHFNANQA